MSIVKMSKFNLIAFASQKAPLLKSLQQFKEVEFDDIQIEEKEDETTLLKKVNNNEELTRIDERLTTVDTAIQLLQKYHPVDKSLKAIMRGNDNYTFNELSEKARTYDWKTVAYNLKDLGVKYSNVKSKISKKYSEIEDLSIWNRLDVNPQELKKLKNVTSYLGSIPIKLKSSFINKISELKYTYYEELKITKEDVYYLVISDKSNEEKEKLDEVFRNSSFSLAELNIDKEPNSYISDIKKEIEQLKVTKRGLKKEIKNYLDDLPHLEAIYEYLRNKKLRIETMENLAQTEKTCVIKGWVPTGKLSVFEKTIKSEVGDNYYLKTQEADRDDSEVPIKLKNGKIASAFESLTGMYAYPKYNEIDPTPFLTPFYIVFFGMMGADVGYGLVLLLGTLFVLKCMNLNKSNRLFVQFFFYLSFSVIIWGLIYGSYFGLPLVKGLIDPGKDYNKLLVGSVLFGIVHIFFGLALKAYLLIKAKKPMEAVYDVLFWYMTLTGGMLYLLFKMTNLNPTVATVSGIIAVIGMIGIVLTGGREAKSVGAKLGGGLYSLYGISSYVGDFVSYSRLMALGLSGGFIAQAINMIIGMVSGSWIGLIFVPIIFVCGHFFNMFLSFLGGYVHTSRLMYVEFFGKFYEGGGKPFRDFRTDSKYINIED